MWGLTLDTWNNIMVGALWVAAVAAVAVVVATRVSIDLGMRETAQAQAELDRYKASAEAKVAEARQEGLAAGRAAADANTRAAEANEQAARAQLELAHTNERLLQEQRRLADARWRLERVERGVMPRGISAQQAQAIVERLRAIRSLGSVDIVTVDSRETLIFAARVMTILRDAGIEVRMTVGPPVPDGTILYAGNPAGQELAQVFWEVTGRYFGGSLGVRPRGLEAIPEHGNAMLIGWNDAAMQPGDGQPGEGVDAQGHPVPAP
jgi:hypothetical protein